MLLITALLVTYRKSNIAIKNIQKQASRLRQRRYTFQRSQILLASIFWIIVKPYNLKCLTYIKLCEILYFLSFLYQKLDLLIILLAFEQQMQLAISTESYMQLYITFYDLKWTSWNGLVAAEMLLHIETGKATVFECKECRLTSSIVNKTYMNDMLPQNV